MPFKSKETRALWRERNRERIRALERARYWRDPEAAKERMRKFRDAHPGNSAETARRWRANNPGRHQELVAEYKARKILAELSQRKAEFAANRKAARERVSHLGYVVVGNDSILRNPSKKAA